MKRIIGLFVIFITVSGYAQELEGLSNPVRINFAAKESVAPDIFMIYKNAASTNAAGMMEVDIRILDDSGVTEVRVDQEDVTINAADTIVLSYAFSPGSEIEVYAKDRFNNAKEKSFIIRQQEKSTALTPTTVLERFHALIIGVNEYEDPNITTLTEPIKDATLLKDMLTGYYNFKNENVRFLQNPTYEQLVLVFEDLSREIGPGDLLLIFYAGHGYYNERTNIGYWLPADAQKANTVRWFRNSALVENIGAINSKHTLLISDACFSGSIFKTRAAFNNANPDIANLLRKPSRKAMTSGSLTTVPDKSVFMRYLLKVLAENNNKYLTSDVLFDEIRLAMRNNSDTRPLFGEIQNVGDEGGNFVFIRQD